MTPAFELYVQAGDYFATTDQVIDIFRRMVNP